MSETFRKKIFLSFSSLFLLVSLYLFSCSDNNNPVNNNINQNTKGWFQQGNGITNLPLTQVCVTSPTTCFAITNYDEILKTSDSGNNWNVKKIETGTNILKIFFTSANIGYAVLADGIYKTNDAGGSWSKIQAFIHVLMVNISFVSDNTGWIAYKDSGSMSYLCKTTNGGINWIQQYSNMYMTRICTQ